MPEPRRSAYKLYRLFWAGLDLIYPPICGGCGKAGVSWCEACQEKVQIIQPPICNFCGRRLKASGLCALCRTWRPHFEAMRSWADFEGPLREALHRLKYERDIGLGVVLARPLIQYLVDAGWPVHVVVPVPLGVARQRERGYNQAALIARPVALASGLAYRPKALRRVRETHSQVGLSLEERRENVREAFKARPDLVAGVNVLIVDDTVTTAATMEACAVGLKEAGAERVYGLSVARAVRSQ